MYVSEFDACTFTDRSIVAYLKGKDTTSKDI